MSLHEFLIILRSMPVTILDYTRIDDELSGYIRELNENNTIIIHPDPCLLTKFNHFSERRKLKETCQHPKIHSFLININAFVNIVTNYREEETEFSKTLNTILLPLREGKDVIINPDCVCVEKYKDSQERFAEILDIFSH